jgi:hypothetical protein
MGKDRHSLDCSRLKLFAAPAHNVLAGHQAKPQTPSAWFAAKFPAHTRFGSAFLEAEYETAAGLTRLTALSINEDFFAAILGGNERLKHKVVFLVPERQFLFLDLRRGVFSATTEDQLKVLLSQLLLGCAAEMPPCVDLHNLFLTFRDDKVLSRIVRRAKAMLAVKESFFDNCPYPRERDHEDLALLFTRTTLTRASTGILTIHDCHESFTVFCKGRGIAPMGRKAFVMLMKGIIKEQFNRTVRNDLIPVPGSKQKSGWKGITQADVEREPLTAEVEMEKTKATEKAEP